jgi:hypothetical protein
MCFNAPAAFKSMDVRVLGRVEAWQVHQAMRGQDMQRVDVNSRVPVVCNDADQNTQLRFFAVMADEVSVPTLHAEADIG